MLTKGCVAVPGPRVAATELASADGAAGGGVGASSGGGGYAGGAGDGDLALAASGAVSRPHRVVMRAAIRSRRPLTHATTAV